ncbi:hypothetical protein J6590_012642 [Homalodisca vitripennis]|nr:hypothetical protein J6590_012642 [Homalodisca vitripennis]
MEFTKTKKYNLWERMPIDRTHIGGKEANRPHTHRRKGGQYIAQTSEERRPMDAHTSEERRPIDEHTSEERRPIDRTHIGGKETNRPHTHRRKGGQYTAHTLKERRPIYRTNIRGKGANRPHTHRRKGDQ